MIGVVAKTAFRRTWRNQQPLSLKRSLAMKTRQEINTEPIPAGHTMESILPPKDYIDFPEPNTSVKRKPATAAYSVNVDKGTICDLDCVWVDKSKKKLMHGRYGELDSEIIESVPLEYLPLLRCAAEAVGVIGEIQSKSSIKSGTLLVFGASQPSGLAVLQVGTAANMAVVGVVGGEHSGHDEMVDTVKGLTNYPGFVVPEEYAIVKQDFRDLVLQTCQGEENVSRENTKYVEEFHTNCVDYCLKYPSGYAAINPKHFEFKGKEKDRQTFMDNMEAYYSQFPTGGPNISLQELQSVFDETQYAIFKQAFVTHEEKIATFPESHTTAWLPSQIVKDLCDSPQQYQQVPPDPQGQYYNFNILQSPPSSHLTKKPIQAAVIVPTPSLVLACEALKNAPTLKEKRFNYNTCHIHNEMHTLLLLR